MNFVAEELSATGKFQEGNAFLRRTSGNDEVVLAIRLCEASVAFRDIGRNGKRSAIKLIDEKIVSARKCLGKCRHPVCKVYRFLVTSSFSNMNAM